MSQAPIPSAATGIGLHFPGPDLCCAILSPKHNAQIALVLLKVHTLFHTAAMQQYFTQVRYSMMESP